MVFENWEKLSFRLGSGFYIVFSIKSLLLLNMFEGMEKIVWFKSHTSKPLKLPFFFPLESVKMEKELSHLKTHLLIPRIWFQPSPVHLNWLYWKRSLSSPVSQFQWLQHFAILLLFPAEYGSQKRHLGLFFK